MISFVDSPIESVPGAIINFKAAAIQFIMFSGDLPLIALVITNYAT